MDAAAKSFRWEFLDPARLMGPIFDKELRISSRRRMSYIIRSAYCLSLGFYVVITWAFAVRMGAASSSLIASRLSEVGKQTAGAIIIFQFFATQLLAVLFLSTSVGDEIRKGTLSVLMTTPIGSLQIILGKLLSGLFQLILLLGISLPLLAIVRVFGGVPWDQIVAGLCITLTAAILAGSLTILLSVLCRHAYTVVLTAVVTYLLAFGAIPALLHLLGQGKLISRATIGGVTFLINPFVALYSTIGRGPGARTALPAWPLHCAIMLALAAGLVIVAVAMLRRATLALAFKRSRKSGRRRFIASKPITGSPVMWREMRRGMLGSARGERALFFVLIGAALLIGAAIVIGGITAYFLITALSLAIMLRVAVLAAGAIAGEKEARTLPILLTTTLDDKRIVRDKALAVLYRNAPLLILQLLLYFGFMIRVQALQPQAMLMWLLYVPIMALGTLASVLFVTGSGIYFGSRLRTTTATLAATVGLYLAFYLVITLTTRLLFVAIYTTVLRGAPGFMLQLFSMSTSVLPIIFHSVAGVILSRRAVGRMRQNLF